MHPIIEHTVNKRNFFSRSLVDQDAKNEFPIFPSSVLVTSFEWFLVEVIQFSDDDLAKTGYLCDDESLSQCAQFSLI